jgi:hypothetical protein
MGIIVRNQENRSELQQRLAAELREKMARQSEPVDAPELPDGVSDSAYVKDFEKKFQPNARVVGLIVVCVVVAALVGLVILLTN